ncbi:hypothetical protein [Cognatishimia sp. MH4019]|uniref:hypothetical protein n=1 Tax=Cognatishimia sp. MH4019 TaxID=2854030 RepID=UPI001CD22FC8|nr:hypothetical protein [Cognatishimia sp. MH4019]
MRDLTYWSSRRLVTTVLILNAIMILLGYLDDNIFKHYDERRAGTYISVILLLLLGVTNFRIFLQRRSHLIWLLMAVGFVFLAYDDQFKFHEGFDRDIHRFFGMTQTPLTDRLDDFIIGAYAIFGAGALYLARAEIMRYKMLFGYLAVGFAIVAVSVVLDAVTNDKAVLEWMGLSDTMVSTLKRMLGTFEEVCKLMAEAVFLAGFFEVLRRVRQEQDITSENRAPA